MRYPPSYGYVPARTSYGGYAPSSYGYAPAGTSYDEYAHPRLWGFATNMSLLAVDMDMLLPEPTKVDTLLLTGGYACWICLVDMPGGYAWWICLSQLEQQHHELDTQHCFFLLKRGKA